MFWTLPSFLTALALFCIFVNLDIGSIKVINFAGSHTLAVYILHQMPFFYDHLWNVIFKCNAQDGSALAVPYMIFVDIAVFAGACIIDACFDKILFDPVIGALKKTAVQFNRRFLR